MKKICLFFQFISVALYASDSFEETSFKLSSRAINMSRAATQELEKSGSENVKRGIKLLEEALQEPSFKRLNLDIQVDIYLKLAAAYHRQNEFGKEETLLKNLAKNPLMHLYEVQLTKTLGEFYLKCKRLSDAESILKGLTKIHPKTLSQQDRDDIATLWEALSKHYDTLLQNAEQKRALLQFEAALPLYELLLESHKAKTFPKTESLIIRKEMGLKLQFRVSEGYFFSEQYDKALITLERMQKQKPTPATSTLYYQGLLLLARTQSRVNELEAAHTSVSTYISFFPTEEAYLLGFEIALAQQNEERKAFFLSHLHTPYARTQAELLQALSYDKESDRTRIHASLKKLSTSVCAFEALFQAGLLHKKDNELEEAVICFEEALSLHTPQRTASISTSIPANRFKARLINCLINCYIELAKSQNPESENAYLKRAESCLKELSSIVPEEQTILASAEIAFFKAYLLQDQQALSDLILRYEKLQGSLTQPVNDHLALLIATANKDLVSIEENQSPYSKLVRALLASTTNELLTLPTELPSALPVGNEKKRDLIDRLRIEALRSHDKQAAIDASLEFLQEHPKSPYIPEVEFLLGTLLFETNQLAASIQTLERLVKERPNLRGRDQALFLLAHILTPASNEQARNFRRELVSCYPHSKFAATSFFLYYPELEYQNASPVAIKHLEEFQLRFKNSHLQIIAHYYLGRALKQKEHFLKAFLLYEKEKNKLPEKEIPIYQFVGDSSLLQEGSQKSLELLHTRIDSTHPLFYETELKLAKTYIEAGSLEAARKLLGKQLNYLLESSHRATGLETLFQIKAELLLGQIEMIMKKFEKAFEQFEKAEMKALGELLLEVRLAKSDCLRELGKFDDAILLLSQVINDSTASQLRIKAMLKRAEIYEAQKRYELAIKQLEATQYFPGEWGLRAKEKLEVYYAEIEYQTSKPETLG